MSGPWYTLIHATLRRPGISLMLAGALLVGGLIVNPLWGVEGLARDPVAVDAIPDLGENQQIVFTRWPGRSPRDIEDQITYPLTTQLLGLAGVKAIRSASMFGFSSVYVIFEDGVDFYWARARILEKLNALPEGTLPQGASPTLGPDATALGQIYWYTLEGRDPETGEVVGGWDLHELRDAQDWRVRYALQATPGVAEVASIGGHVREYQIDVDPRKLHAYDLPLARLAKAVREANLDVGARTMEINRVEYVVRGIGQLKGLADLEEVVVAERGGRPLRLKDVARVRLGPAGRRGALDVNGAEAVGGVVVARYGENPTQVIERLEAEIAKLQPSLPRRTLADGRVSQITVVPFYNRAEVVAETLATLSDALIQQILITVIVVIVLLGDLRGAAVISASLPLAVLGSFILMRVTGVTANVMSLAGIAIAIGTMVDMGVVLTESMHARLMESEPGARLAALAAGAAEVAPAVVTSAATTILSFLPVFGLTAAEGKLFHPLAYTKTFALLAALLLSILLLPTLAALILKGSPRRGWAPSAREGVLMAVVALLLWRDPWPWGLIGAVISISDTLDHRLEAGWLPRAARTLERLIIGGVVLYGLAWAWAPLGPGAGAARNLGFVALVVMGLLGVLWLFLAAYPALLRLALRRKLVALSLPLLITLFGLLAWRGFDPGWLPESWRGAPRVAQLEALLPGLESEFMPNFDEGQFLYMPTVTPHASIGEALAQLRRMDAAIASIPEVEEAVGKLGRADSALDPAPVSMFETVVTYKPEWGEGPDGSRVRQWRPHIRSTDDIWSEIVAAASQPGLTSAPKLMPINTRIVMLQSGTRAPTAVRLQGPSLEALERAGVLLERALKAVEGVRPETVFAERVVGKPYLELELDREALGRYGLSVADAQRVIQLALGGIPLTTVIEGRARIAARVRYERGARSGVEDLERLLIPTSSGATIPLKQIADLRYAKGPQVIKSEDTALTSYVIFDRAAGIAEVEIVERVEAALAGVALPEGVRYSFAGSYQNQQRSAARLKLLVPVALASIFLVLSLQFRRASTILIIYSGVAVAVGGGFALMWLYGRAGFLDVSLMQHGLRDLFGVGPINLSVAVWVGFIALAGIATDDGVVMATYLQSRLEAAPATVEGIRAAALDAGRRRVRACLMTTATTLLALLPILTSTGRGSDVMIPMAIPVVGGMAVELVTLFVVPVLYAARAEWGLRPGQR